MITDQVNRNMHRILRELRHIQIEVEVAILSTPSSSQRNLLTEVNIYLMDSITKLTKVLR